MQNLLVADEFEDQPEKPGKRADEGSALRTRGAILLGWTALLVALSAAVLLPQAQSGDPARALAAASFLGLNFLAWIRSFVSLLVFRCSPLTLVKLGSLAAAQLLFFLLIPALLAGGQPSEWAVAVGLVFYAVGALGASVAEYQLYAHQQASGDDRQMFRGGMYAWCRNPALLSSLTGLLGYAFIAANFWAFVLVGAAVALCVFVVVPLRDRRMEELFGDEFEEYRGQVKALIPRIL